MRLKCAQELSDKETTCGGNTTIFPASLATAGVSVCVCVCVIGGCRLIGSCQPQGRVGICYFNSQPLITCLSRFTQTPQDTLTNLHPYTKTLTQDEKKK